MSKDRQFDNFDEFAEDYCEMCNQVVKSSGANRDYFSEYKIVELLKFEKPKEELRILDFGCGDGSSAFFIRKHFPNAAVFGVDVSEKSITIAQKRNITNTIFNKFDGIKLPFKEEEFDIVFTSMVFHHIEHKLHKGVLKEICKVLKKEGRFYNFEHNPNNPLTKKAVNECEYDKDAVLLKPSYNKKITSNSGLKVEKLNYTLFFPRHKLFNFFLGLEKILTWCPIGAQYYVKAIKII